MKSLTGCCPGGLRGEEVPGWEALGAGDAKQHDGDERHLLLNSSRLAGDCPGPHGSGTKGLVGPRSVERGGLPEGRASLWGGGQRSNPAASSEVGSDSDDYPEALTSEDSSFLSLSKSSLQLVLNGMTPCYPHAHLQV